MGRIRAFFGGLRDLKASEFYAGWGGIAVKGLCLVNPAACGIMNTVATTIGFESGESMVAVMLTYAALRMTSKAAKAASGKKQVPVS